MTESEESSSVMPGTSQGAVEALTGLDAETLNMMLETIRDVVRDAISDERLLQLDHDDECPVDMVRDMCGDKLGIQLLFIPEEYGGMGGATIDVYRVCQQMASLDLGVATSVLATFLGSDPIFFGATSEQKSQWLTEMAERGVLYAYGATEPDAGSDLGALKTTATPELTDGRVSGYRLNGRKQWISNGGITDKYTILASAPGGRSWFVLDRVIQYSTTRIQGGAPLSEKQGYTHKLIVPHAIRLEAARAFSESVATRIDAGEGAGGALNTEGAIAKYLATEAGNLAADAAIQAHGGYGYTREYLVEKIKRDVRITTIYEGTSEIMEMTIARDRWQQHLKTAGRYYLDRAAGLRDLDA